MGVEVHPDMSYDWTEVLNNTVQRELLYQLPGVRGVYEQVGVLEDCNSAAGLADVNTVFC